MAKLAEAINLYNPKAQWTLLGDDYDTLDWHSVDIAKPTKAELENLLSQVDSHKAQEEAKAEADKAALLTKLGITADEAKLLLS